MLQRWKFGNYTLTYNPKTDDRNLKATEGDNVTVNGLVTSSNVFYDDEKTFSFDLYDKPTYFEKSALKTFSSGSYIGVSEKRTTGELFMIRPGNTVDVISKTDGSVSKTITPALAGTPIALSHMDSKIAILYNDGTLFVCDENGVQISKYSITDADYKNASSLTWDYGNNVYVLNKFGKIFKTDITNGANSLVFQADDFSENNTAGNAIYKGMHIANGFFCLTRANTLRFYDSTFTPIYATDIIYRMDIMNVADISFGDYSKEYYVISSDKLFKFYPNSCGADIESIKKEILNGVVTLVDEKNSTSYLIVKNLDIKRKRNRNDARYDISITGKLM